MLCMLHIYLAESEFSKRSLQFRFKYSNQLKLTRCLCHLLVQKQAINFYHDPLVINLISLSSKAMKSRAEVEFKLLENSEG